MEHLLLRASVFKPLEILHKINAKFAIAQTFGHRRDPPETNQDPLENRHMPALSLKFQLIRLPCGIEGPDSTSLTNSAVLTGG